MSEKELHCLICDGIQVTETHDEVDIGVGIQHGPSRYMCEECRNCWDFDNLPLGRIRPDHRATIASLERELEGFKESYCQQSQHIASLEGRVKEAEADRDTFAEQNQTILKECDECHDKLTAELTTLKESNRLALEQLQVMAGQVVMMREALENIGVLRLAENMAIKSNLYINIEPIIIQALSTPPSQAEIRWKAMGDVVKLAEKYLEVDSPFYTGALSTTEVEDMLRNALAALDHPAAKGETI